jgi:hypothetical protein
MRAERHLLPMIDVSATHRRGHVPDTGRVQLLDSTCRWQGCLHHLFEGPPPRPASSLHANSTGLLPPLHGSSLYHRLKGHLDRRRQSLHPRRAGSHLKQCVMRPRLMRLRGCKHEDDGQARATDRPARTPRPMLTVPTTNF